MNLGTMKTALRRAAGVDTTDPLADWINAALTEFTDAYNWSFMEGASSVVTVAGSSTVALPADFLMLFKLKVISGPSGVMQRPALRYVSRLAMDDEGRFAYGAMGEPTHFNLVGNNVVDLWPIPDQIYTMTIFYEKFAPELVADVDVPAVPTRYHYTIVEGAIVRALQAESEEERAASARVIFEDSIDRHITKLGGNRQGGTFNTVRDAMGYGA